jgi:hypothetical protein
LELQNIGFKIQGVVCDGRKNLPQWYDEIPVQMCRFHQTAIVRQSLTKRPKLQASSELMEIVDVIKKTDKESYSGLLMAWL